MAWAADYTQEDDLTDISVGTLQYQVWYAIAEREWITGWGGSEMLPVAGIDIFKATNSEYPTWTEDYPPTAGTVTDVWSITYAQLLVEWLCANFVTNITSGGFDGETSVDVYTPQTLRTAAGLNSDGFTRHIPDGSGSYTTAYGYFTAGDYVCPHLWNELKACLKLMTSVLLRTHWEAGASRLQHDGVGASLTSYADAQADALDGVQGWNTTEDSAANTTPQAWTQSSQDTHYRTNVHRAKDKIVTTIEATILSADVDFYAALSLIYNAWYNEGDWADADNNKIQLVDQQSYTSPGSVTMTSVDVIPWTGPPDFPVSDPCTSRGWQLRYPKAVAHYESTLTYSST